MNEKSLRTLEFDIIKNKVEKYAVTSGGKEKASKLAPYESVYEVREALKETKEAYEL